VNPNRVRVGGAPLPARENPSRVKAGDSNLCVNGRCCGTCVMHGHVMGAAYSLMWLVHVMCVVSGEELCAVRACWMHGLTTQGGGVRR